MKEHSWPTKLTTPTNTKDYLQSRTSIFSQCRKTRPGDPRHPGTGTTCSKCENVNSDIVSANRKGMNLCFLYSVINSKQDQTGLYDLIWLKLTECCWFFMDYSLIIHEHSLLWAMVNINKDQFSKDGLKLVTVHDMREPYNAHSHRACLNKTSKFITIF